MYEAVNQDRELEFHSLSYMQPTQNGEIRPYYYRQTVIGPYHRVLHIRPVDAALKLRSRRIHYSLKFDADDRVRRMTEILGALFDG